jgi:hypothetical protein
MAITGKDLLNRRKQNTTKKTGITGSDLLEARRLGTSAVNGDYISSYIKDTESYIKNAQKQYEGIGWGNAADTYAKQTSTYDNLEKRRKTINSWLKLNQNKVANYDSLAKSLADLEKSTADVYGSFKSAKDYYSQWDTQEAYDAYKKTEDEKKAILEAPDFKQYSQAGADIKNPTLQDINAPMGNPVTYYRDNASAFDVMGEEYAKKVGTSTLYKHMTDDEIGIYNYYLGKGDTERANAYLASINDTLTRREAGDIVERVGDSDFLKMLFAAQTTGQRAATAFGNFGNYLKGTEADPTTATQYASGMIREDLGTFGKGAFDLITTTSDMLPSVLAGAAANIILPGAGTFVGAGLMGASATGNAYAEMRNLGYDENQARGYATLVGVSETALSALFSGVKGIGGKLTNHAVSKFVSGIDNGFARVAIKYGSEMLSEGLEESVQSVLEPMFKRLTTGDEFDVDWGEVAYSGLLGAISAGILNAAPTTFEIAQTMAAGKNIKANEGVERLKKLGTSMSADSAAYKIANKIDENTGAYKIGMLLNEVGATLSEQNMSDIRTSLERKGVAPKDAATVAKWMQKAVNGEYFTARQRAALENNDALAQTLVDVVINPKSTIAQRIGEVASLRELAQTKATPTKAEKSAPTAEEASEVTENAPEKEKASEGKKTASVPYAVMSSVTDNVSEVIGKVGDKYKVRLNDGTELLEDAAEMSPNTERLFATAKDLGLNAESANAFLKNYDGSMSAADYAQAYAEAYRYGEYNFAESEMRSDGFSALLSESQRKIAYESGRIDRKYKTEAKQAEIKKTDKKQNKGKLHNTFVGANERQKASLKALGVLAEALGIDIYTFESETNAEGVHIGKNGWYDPKDNSIHIDVYAGSQGHDTILFTAAHELTHMVRRWSPAKFKVFADFLMEKYGEQGKSVSELVRAQMSKAEDNGRTLTFDEAYEELVADSCESFLADGDAIAKIAELKAKDKTLWEKIKDYLTKLVARIKAAYEGLEPDSEEGKFVASLLDSAEELRDLWVEAVVDASTAYNEGEIVSIDETSESVTPAFSERTWTQSDYVVHRDEMAKKISEALGVTVAKAKSYIDDINSIAKMIADDRVRLDYEASSFGSAFVSNVEYGGSFDYTTLCKKRRIYTGTFTEIQKRLKDTALSPDDILKIRNLLIEAGVEATCGLCYVEGSRANMGKFAKEFIRLYKRDNPNAWIPNMADVNTPDGVEQMRISHPEVYEQYEYFWNHYGKLKDSDPALFASQQKPKLYEARKEYKGEILEQFSKDTSVAKKNRNGGIRMQSFSDFEIVHLIDTMQVIMDMSTVGLAGQAYTKVPEFALAFGDTGLKINLSLIAKGVDENGKLIFDDREGMPHKTAFDIREKYSKNVGTIIVAFTDEQILAAMADERIDFIIPFHRSQWKKGQYGAMGLPNGTKDYTYQQNEKFIKPTYHEYRGRMVRDKASNYMPNKYWDFSKSGKENAEIYLNMCAEENKRPKFYKFLDYDGNGRYSLKEDGSTDGYWKLLIDFKMYDNDGVGSPQEAVVPSFNMDEATKMLDEYKGGHANYPVAQGVVDKFVSEYEGVKYSDRDSSYMDAVNRGDMETAQRMVDEAAKAAGYTPVTRYHQTGVKFNEFSNERPDAALNDSDTPNGFFFKENDHDIGVGADFVKTGHGGSIQMRVYLKHNNMLYFKNRDEAREWYSNNVPGYRELLKKYNAHLSDFEKINSENNKKMFDELIALEESGQSTTEKDLAIMEKYDKIMDEWIENRQEYETSLRAGMRDLLNKYFIENDSGYDGIELADDGHRYIDMKREDVHTFIVFKNTQVKSADPVTYDDNGNVIPLSQRFNAEDPNIRFSERDSDTVSNRTLLAEALEGITLNDIEKKKLADYKANAEKLDAAEARLKEVRAEIKEISFSKGTRDKQRLSTLKEEATQLTNRINIYDRRLINLEATSALKGVLDRAKADVKAREKAKAKADLDAYKERSKAREKEIAEAYRESRAANVEGRRKTEMRHKILKVVHDLNKVLENPTKEKHIPIALQKPVAEALAAINMDTVTAEERLAKYDEAIAKAEAEGNTDKVKKLKETRANIESQGHNLEDKLTRLYALYELLKNSEDPLIKNSYDENIAGLISEVQEKVGDTPIRKMTLAQLNLVYDMFKALKKTISDANKMFLEAKTEKVSDNASNVATEILAKAKEKDKEAVIKKWGKKYLWSILKPTEAMEFIGSDTFSSLFANVRAGEETWARDTNEAKAFFQETARKHGYWKWDFEKKYGFVDKNNRRFELTLEQMLSLYAYSKRDQADLHLDIGGFVFDDNIEVIEKKYGAPVKYNMKTQQTYNLTKSELDTIIDELGDGQKAFVDEMQTFLSETMGDKGNEVSLAMYDIKLFNEKNYFPLKTAKYYIGFDAEKKGLPNLKNSGFSKKLTPNANNPIVLSNFLDVWGNHVNEMSTYHAFVLPLEDFMRVFNYTERDGGYDSVRAKIVSTYGKAAAEYIENLMTDLNGGARSDYYTGFFGKPLALFKKSATFLSLSVIIQQPSSIARAFAYIDPKYFATNPETKNYKSEWEVLKKYAPVAIIKEMGSFDIGIGRQSTKWITAREYNGFKEKAGAIVKDSDYRDDVLSKGPAIADMVSWVYIWEAAKKKVATEQNLEGEALLEAAGKVFTETIVRTQVYDSVLSKSGIMRSKSDFAKLLTAFMAEPITTLNLAFSGLMQGVRGDRKAMAKSFASVGAATILNAILVSLVYAARDDDEDENYGEKYLESLTTEVLEGVNILTYMPYIKDLWSYVQGYSVDRADLTIFEKLIDSLNGLFSDTKSGWAKARALTESISTIFGLPVRNVLRDAEALFNVTKGIVEPPEETDGAGAAAIKGLRSASPKIMREAYKLPEKKPTRSPIIEATESEDFSSIKDIIRDEMESGKTESEAKSALRSRMTSYYKPLYVEAYASGDTAEMARIRKILARSGLYGKTDDVIETAKNWLKK